MVYFTLKDRDRPLAIEKMVQACQKYLKGHPGEGIFARGPRFARFERGRGNPRRDFRLWALQVVFDSREAHDAIK